MAGKELVSMDDNHLDDHVDEEMIMFGLEMPKEFLHMQELVPGRHIVL